MIIGKVDNTSLSALGQRLIKMLRFGLSDIVEPKQAAPFGIDSNPIKGMVAIYADTAAKSSGVAIGYIAKDLVAEAGEIRIFSTDSDGNVKSYVWCKKDGKLQLAGDNDNAVRYSPLNSGLQDFKDLIQAELTKIQTGIIAGGGIYTPGILTIDISNAKIDEIQTP